MNDSKFRRGQIWWMKGYEAHKDTVPTRPVMIVSDDFINSNMANNNIIVVPLSSNTTRLYIKTNVGLYRHTRELNTLKCGELININKNQLVSYESTVDEDVLRSVEKAILIALGLEKGEIPEEEKNPAPPEETVLEETVEEETTTDESRTFTITRSGKNIRWDTENEAYFMKMYQEFGAEYTALTFEISKNYAIVKANELRNKYPEFGNKKEDEKNAN